METPGRAVGVIPARLQSTRLPRKLLLADTGRVLLRPSGTEPLVRVMVEGEDAAEVAEICQDLASKVERILG